VFSASLDRLGSARFQKRRQRRQYRQRRYHRATARDQSFVICGLIGALRRLTAL